MEGIELICFQIISAVGTARSNYIEAIDLASQGKFDEAEKLIEEGQEIFTEGHKAHAKLIAQSVKKLAVTVLQNSVLSIVFIYISQDKIKTAKRFRHSLIILIRWIRRSLNQRLPKPPKYYQLYKQLY